MNIDEEAEFRADQEMGDYLGEQIGRYLKENKLGPGGRIVFAPWILDGYDRERHIARVKSTMLLDSGSDE